MKAIKILIVMALLSVSIANAQLLEDMLTHTWDTESKLCNTLNRASRAFDKIYGGYIVLNGEVKRPNEAPYIEIKEISPTQVHMYVGGGPRAKSEGLFRWVLETTYTRQHNGSVSAQQWSVNAMMDNNNMPLQRNFKYKKGPESHTIYMCPKPSGGQNLPIPNPSLSSVGLTPSMFLEEVRSCVRSNMLPQWASGKHRVNIAVDVNAAGRVVNAEREGLSSSKDFDNAVTKATHLCFPFPRPSNVSWPDRVYFSYQNF